MNDSQAQNSVNPVKAVIAVLIVGFVAICFIRLILMPPRYVYVVEARTQVMYFELDPKKTGEIKWRTQGVIFCSKENLAIPEFSVDPSICGSQWLSSYYSEDAEQVLEIAAPATVQLTSVAGGGMRMLLKSKIDTSPVARFSSDSETIVTGNRVILLWPAWDSNDTIVASHGVYPFKGKTVLGQDVNWSSNHLLLSGSVSLYSSDRSAATGRKKINQSPLMLGDQIVLNEVNAKELIFPKGFIYFEDGSTEFEVRVFGHREGLGLSRYGESGYDLEPGIFAKLTNDPMLSWMTPLLLLLITLGNNLFGAGAPIPFWIRQKFMPKSQSNE